MRLSAPQIATLARNAGFRGTNVAIAVAVALAESGGKTDAVNTSNADGSRDYGLWQINSVHGALLASGQWANPADNARMAYTVWRGSGWSAWTTYNSGAYASHLAAGNSASSAPAAPVAFTSGPTVANTGGNPKNYKGGTDATTNGHGVYRTYFLDPGPGKWRTPFTSAKPRAIPDPPVGYSATVPHHYYGGMATYAAAFEKATNAGTTAPPYPTLNPVNAARVRVWIRAFSPDGVSSAQLAKADAATLSKWYSLILTGSVGFDAGGTHSEGPGSSIEDFIIAIQGFFSFITDAHNWLRIAEFVGGGVLILLALERLAGINAASVTRAVTEVVK